MKAFYLTFLVLMIWGNKVRDYEKFIYDLTENLNKPLTAD